VNLKVLAPAFIKVPIPWEKEFNYAEEFKTLDLNAVVKDLACPDDGFAGVVAGRLWALWAAFHSYGVAQRWHR